MIIGLTGGIASGKNEAAKVFAGLGAHCIDADAVAHSLYAKGQLAYKRIIKIFGRGILNNSGVINRKKLGEIVFSDKASMNKLEAILHASIIAEIKSLANRSKKQVTVINAPLLFESGVDKMCDYTAVMWLPLGVQKKRLAKRDGLNKKQVSARICSQMPFEKKAELSDFVIDNSGTKADLTKNVEALYKLLTECKK